MYQVIILKTGKFSVSAEIGDRRNTRATQVKSAHPWPSAVGAVMDTAGVQPRPQPKPTLTDFSLQPYSHT